MARYSNTRFTRIEKSSLFWSKNDHVKLKVSTPTELATQVTDIVSLTKELTLLDQRKRELGKKRDEIYTSANKIAVALAKQVLADDPDSPDVKELGLIPASERKRPSRKPKSAA
ncbi:MAG: hypothetical protein HUU55_01905 [Myxococcales bacterium]|nr:hypothetical protein [Myxococcales bacterium]